MKRHLPLRLLWPLLLFWITLDVHARPNPFYPEVTSKDVEQQATQHPFASYDAIGYIKSSERLLALIASPDQRILYLQVGQVLGRERYVFTGVKDGSRLTFGKSVSNMDGKEENWVQIKEITGK